MGAVRAALQPDSEPLLSSDTPARRPAWHGGPSPPPPPSPSLCQCPPPPPPPAHNFTITRSAPPPLALALLKDSPALLVQRERVLGAPSRGREVWTTGFTPHPPPGVIFQESTAPLRKPLQPFAILAQVKLQYRLPRATALAWHHVAVVVERQGAIVLYVDVLPVKSEPLNRITGSVSASAIGLATDGPGKHPRGFTGRLSNVRMWAGPRAPADLRLWAPYILRLPEHGLEANWPLDDNGPDPVDLSKSSLKGLFFDEPCLCSGPSVFDVGNAVRLGDGAHGVCDALKSSATHASRLKPRPRSLQLRVSPPQPSASLWL